MTLRLYIVIAWIPFALLLGVQFYTHQFEGWGQWSAAPLFLLPVVLSLALTVMGIAICFRIALERRPLVAAAMATLTAAIPALWFLARLIAS